jgi:membrane complex biogenesis BtpA family protein
MNPIPRGLIGVVHLAPLPGDPAFKGDLAAVLDAAARDAEALAAGGADGVIVENFGSWPFPKGDPSQPTPPVAIAAIARAVLRVAAASGLPVGVNVLRNDGRAALGIAVATGASFIRVNVLSGAVATDQGLIEGRAHELLRERASLGARVAILADVRVKHARPLVERPLAAEVADLVQRAGADAVIATGEATGGAIVPHDLRAIASAAGSAPVVLGSGVTPERAPALAPFADAAIVGTWIKRDGDVRNAVDAARVRALASALRGSWRR